MAFPTSPSDGQLATVNNIAYVYSSTSNSWTRQIGLSSGNISTPLQTVVANSTTSTSTTTGALVVTGGVGVGGTLSVGANVTVTGNVLPSANVTYNLGSPTQRWKDLWLSGSTIDLAGATIKSDPVTGAIALIPTPTTANPNPIGLVISASGTTSTVATTAGVPSANAISNSANTATATGTSTFANANVTSATTSTSTTTGALVVTGGVGVGGQITAGNIMTTSGVYWANGAAYSSGSGGWNGGYVNNLNTANAVITGGYINNLANLTATTAVATNFSTGNAVITGGYISALSNGTITTLNTVTSTAGTLNATAGNITTLSATNFSSGNILATGTTAGTWSTANVSLYDSVTALTTNQTFYPQFSNLSTSGNSITGVSTGLAFNPSTSTLTVSGNLAFPATANIGLVAAGISPSYSGFYANTSCTIAATIPAPGAVFTIEGWWYPTADPSPVNNADLFTVTGTSGDLAMHVSNGGLRLDGNGAIITGTSAQVLFLNTWTHIAMIHDTGSGTPWKIYVNGTLTLSAGYAFSPTSTALTVRSGPTAGYVSNFRYTNNVVYSANFTPPTNALTAISGTQFLTLQGPTIVDNSGNGRSITNTNVSTAQSPNPFGSGSPGTNLLYDGSGSWGMMGNISVLGNITPKANTTYTLGTSALRWATTFSNNVTAGNITTTNGLFWANGVAYSAQSATTSKAIAMAMVFGG